MTSSSLTDASRASAGPQATTFELTRPAEDRDPGPESARVNPAALPAQSLNPIVIGFGRFGDMVMLSSLLRLLHHRYRGPCLVLAAGPWSSRIYLGHPDVAQVWTFTRHFPFLLSLTWWRVLRLLRRTGPSPIYVCERQPRQLVRIRRMLAASGVDPARCVFIDDVIAGENEHWIDRFLRLGRQTPPALNAADYPAPPASCRLAPRLGVSDSERAEIQRWLEARGWSGRDLILIQPGNYRSMSRRRDRWRRSNADDKAWPIENWASLLQRVQGAKPDALIVLCGAPQEGLMLQDIQLAAARPQVVAAELPLRQLLALCQAAHSMISVDTGPAHAAAALGLPLAVLYGAESQRQWLPRSPFDSPIVGVGGPPISTRADQIAVDAVFDAWCSLLATMRRSGQRQTDLTLRAS